MHWLVKALIVLVVPALASSCSEKKTSSNNQPPEQSNIASPTSPATGAAGQPARLNAHEVVNSYPHDPEAFLQGLAYHDGSFFESTGQYGESTLRRVEAATGRVVKKLDLPPNVFGEGLALVADKLFQLTWQNKKGFVYDRETFRLIQEFAYETEGWGLTFDGTSLILSDGTSELTFLDLQSFKPIKKLGVTFNGRPVSQINELEFIEGEIWANVWHEDVILRIDPSSGRVTSYLNLRDIRPRETFNDDEAVLNGIAYDASQKRIFVSGKRWPRIFEIRIKESK
jgi:glutamine cyclotransferase